MYCMNIMKFEVPDICIRFMEAKSGDKNEETKIDNSIMHHHFNSKIILHLPDTPSVPYTLVNALSEDTSFYCIRNLSVYELCEYKFIQAFVACGKVYAYSSNTRLDVDDCAAFIPSGSLFLLIDNFKYYELGIVGKLSSHILRKPTNKYFIEVNTNAQGFTPGKKLYQRTHQALSACPLHFDFHVTWTPNDDKVCPSSIAKYFHDKGYKVEEIDSCMRQTLKTNITIPKLHGTNKEEFDPSHLLEWIGMQALDIDVDNLNTPEPACVVPSLNIAHISGLYTPTNIKEIIKKLRAWLNEREPESVPWVCMSVFGPTDCLISWSKSEHAFKTNGENFYSLLILRDGLFFYTVEDSKKPQRFHVKSSNK